MAASSVSRDAFNRLLRLCDDLHDLIRCLSALSEIAEENVAYTEFADRLRERNDKSNPPHRRWPSADDCEIALNDDIVSGDELTPWQWRVWASRRRLDQLLLLWSESCQSAADIPSELFDDSRLPIVERWTTRLYGVLQDLGSCDCISMVDADGVRRLQKGVKSIDYFLSAAWCHSGGGTRFDWPWKPIMDSLAKFEREARMVAKRLDVMTKLGESSESDTKNTNGVKILPSRETGDESSEQRHTPSEPGVDARFDEAYLTTSDIAKKLELDPENVRKRLSRWRESNAGSGDFKEVTDRKPREAQYLYRFGMARDVLSKNRNSSG